MKKLLRELALWGAGSLMMGLFLWWRETRRRRPRPLERARAYVACEACGREQGIRPSEIEESTAPTPAELRALGWRLFRGWRWFCPFCPAEGEAAPPRMAALLREAREREARAEEAAPAPFPPGWTPCPVPHADAAIVCVLGEGHDGEHVWGPRYCAEPGCRKPPRLDWHPYCGEHGPAYPRDFAEGLRALGVDDAAARELGRLATLLATSPAQTAAALGARPRPSPVLRCCVEPGCGKPSRLDWHPYCEEHGPARLPSSAGRRQGGGEGAPS